jgi:hypothetical protein
MTEKRKISSTAWNGNPVIRPVANHNTDINTTYNLYARVIKLVMVVTLAITHTTVDEDERSNHTARMIL